MYDPSSSPSTMATAAPTQGGAPHPQWANPEPNRIEATAQDEQQFFAPLSTIDEPVRETIMRDVRAVASKLKVVMLPMDRTVSQSLKLCRVILLFGSIANQSCAFSNSN
jgi:hypothetical protein